MPRKTSSTPTHSIGEYAKVGFGLGLGSLAAFLIFTCIALVFFIPGFIIVIKQRKLPKEERNTTLQVVGFILMGIGMIVGLGFGASVFFGELGELL